jgi:3-oxoacyl-[acyl-carrier-protein] synthase-3
MAICCTNGIELKGIVNVIPKYTVSNRDISHLSDIQIEELIKHTGITNRRICIDETESVKTYAIRGVELLLNNLKWNNGDVDALIFITQSAQVPIPSLACQLHGEFNLSSDTICFDINSGCSGYVYGLHTVGSILNSLNKRVSRAIVCCGDFSSRLIKPNDPATQPIFSDAVSITAIEFDPKNRNTAYFNLQTDGNGKNAIYLEKELKSNDFFMKLNGIDVFNYSVNMVPKNINNLFAQSQVNTEKIDLFVFHQANKLINNVLTRSLGLASDKTPETLSLYGNTASASIPVTLVNQLTKNPGPKNVLMCGFGVGFSVASVIMHIHPVFVQNIEV